MSKRQNQNHAPDAPETEPEMPAANEGADVGDEQPDLTLEQMAANAQAAELIAAAGTVPVSTATPESTSQEPSAPLPLGPSAPAPDLSAAAARGTPPVWSHAYLATLPAPDGLDEAECRAELEAIGDPGARVDRMRLERDDLAARARERARQDQLDVQQAGARFTNAMLEAQWSKSRVTALTRRLAELAELAETKRRRDEETE